MLTIILLVVEVFLFILAIHTDSPFWATAVLFIMVCTFMAWAARDLP